MPPPEAVGPLGMASSQIRCCVTHLWPSSHPHTLSHSLKSAALVHLYHSPQAEGGRGRSPERAWMSRVGSDQCLTANFSTSLGTVWAHLVYEVRQRTKTQGGFSKPYPEMGMRGAHLPILCHSHIEHSGKAALEHQRSAVKLPAGAGYLMCFVKKQYRTVSFLTKASGTTGLMC